MVNLTANLPLLLLCQLILSTSGVPHQERSDLIATNEQPLQRIQSQSVSLPEGYVPHPDIGLAYKYHNKSVTWPQARERCNAEGGNLAVIDSELKLNYVVQQEPAHALTHVGLRRLDDSMQWTSVVTGLPLNFDSIPWEAGEPTGGYKCAMIGPTLTGIVNGICDVGGRYICELSIPKN